MAKRPFLALGRRSAECIAALNGAIPAFTEPIAGFAEWRWPSAALLRKFDSTLEIAALLPNGGPVASSRRISAALMVALSLLAAVSRAQYDIRPVMLPIPPFPTVAQMSYLYVNDPTAAFPAVGPFVYV